VSARSARAVIRAHGCRRRNRPRHQRASLCFLRRASWASTPS
jgi:hypothetical protein